MGESEYCAGCAYTAAISGPYTWIKHLNHPQLVNSTAREPIWSIPGSEPLRPDNWHLFAGWGCSFYPTTKESISGNSISTSVA